MAMYDYECKIHGEFEVIQSVNDDPLENCPQCINDGYSEYYCSICDMSIVAKEDSSGCPINETLVLIKESDISKGICSECSISFRPNGIFENFKKRLLKPQKLISKSSFILKGGGWGSSGYSNK